MGNDLKMAFFVPIMTSQVEIIIMWWFTCNMVEGNGYGAIFETCFINVSSY